MTETLVHIWRLLDDITEMDDVGEMQKADEDARGKLGDIYDEMDLRAENIVDLLGR